MTGGADERDLPGIVRADVKDEKSLEEMAKGSRRKSRDRIGKREKTL